MEPHAPFEDYHRPRPLRTYSHKAKTASSNVLPLLRIRESPTSFARKHQRSPGTRDEGCQNDGVVLEEAIDYQTKDNFEDAHELEFEPQYASDTSQSREDYATEDEASLEYSTDEDEDEDKRKTPEQPKSTPLSSMKSRSSSKYLSKPVTDQSHRLRRRPFLLFDKLPPRGFKRLKPRTEDSTTSTLSGKYNLGDGFSQDEAKPNGLIQLGWRPTTKRKLPYLESKVGTLDLTQSSFKSSPKKDQALKQKTMTKKKRAYDNSFLPDPKRAERQRKRQKQLKKKDSPLEDKEMLPPMQVLEPKIILTSAILGNHSNLAEKPTNAAVVSASEQQREQTQKISENVLGEAAVVTPEEDHEQDNTGAEEPTTREPSVELGEFPVNKLPGHSAFNHQQEHQREKKPMQEQLEDPVEMLSKEPGNKPVQEEPAVIEPEKKSPKELLEQHSEKSIEEPVKRPVDEQERQANTTGENDPKPVTTVKENASVKSNSNSNFHPEPTAGTTENPNPVLPTTTTITEPHQLTSNDGTGEQHRGQGSHQGDHGHDQDGSHREETSPGSGWETYISETDIYHTPTPPRSLNSISRAKSAVPTTSRGSGIQGGLKRSSSAV